MNDALINHICDFIDSVINYLELEYDSIYHKLLKENYSQYFDFIGSYYMGGSNAPDTARYFVELILMNSRTQ